MKRFMFALIALMFYFVLTNGKLVAGNDYDSVVRDGVMTYQKDYYPDIVPWHKARLMAESGFDIYAVSPVGAEGIAQFMPPTSEQYGIDPYNPYEAIPCMIRYTNDIAVYTGVIRHYSMANGCGQRFIDAAYNYGMGRIRRLARTHNYSWELVVLKLPMETKSYVNRIQRYKRTFEKT